MYTIIDAFCDAITAFAVSLIGSATLAYFVFPAILDLRLPHMSHLAHMQQPLSWAILLIGGCWSISRTKCEFPRPLLSAHARRRQSVVFLASMLPFLGVWELARMF